MLPHSTSRRLILILFSHVCLGLPNGVRPSGFPTESLYASLHSPYVIDALPIPVFLITLHEWYLLRIKRIYLQPAAATASSSSTTTTTTTTTAAAAMIHILWPLLSRLLFDKYFCFVFGSHGFKSRS